MKVLRKGDQGLEPFVKVISEHTDVFEMLGMEYWVFVEDSLVGLVAVGKEPIQLMAPLGTPLALIRILDYERSTETFTAFSQKALAISNENSVDYALINIPSKYTGTINQFRALGFKVLADTYWMVHNLDGDFEPSCTLSFEKVQRADVSDFLELTKDFMVGSQDNVLNIILENLLDVPEDFKGLWYDQEKLYYAREKDETIGILDLNSNEGTISNIGVAPYKRGRGFGRQIMKFAMKTLKAEGRNEAGLRVHVDNKPAIHLYETLGFRVKRQTSALIWEKTENA